MGLFAGLLLGAIIWFALTQWPITPTATASPSAIPTPAGFDRVACLQAAFNASTCYLPQPDRPGNGPFNENGTFDHANKSYPCNCNTPAATVTTLPSLTPWPEETSPTASPQNGTNAAVQNKTATSASNTSWLYVLTGYEKPGLLQQIMDTPASGLVVDAFQSTPDTPFSKEQVNAFKKNHATVLAYLSIGEAEDYRPYWKPEWNATPPSWMGRVNPDWTGNVKVRYWDPLWQGIVFSYIDQEVEQGFDGAYLDIVDAYEYWSDPLNGETEVLSKDDAANRMIAFISAIRKHAREKNPDFLVFPQNAQELVDYPGYLDAMDGIGREDTWYVGYDDRNAPGSLAAKQADTTLDEQLAPLIKIRQAGKTVLVVDYFAPEQGIEARDFATRARQMGFYPYPADTRTLDNISRLKSEGQVTTEVIRQP
ncbi:endo alpha-1,4 polygalactosaminidase [Candidatus Micrarchaeota archaeon]|nr:endo alpha-1,4 polygalactosaminidase [Candidatus Micrarchaeota archaeon]